MKTHKVITDDTGLYATLANGQGWIPQSLYRAVQVPPQLKHTEEATLIRMGMFDGWAQVCSVLAHIELTCPLGRTEKGRTMIFDLYFLHGVAFSPKCEMKTPGIMLSNRCMRSGSAAVSAGLIIPTTRAPIDIGPVHAGQLPSDGWYKIEVDAADEG